MNAFHELRSPADLMAAAGVIPLSPASAAFLDAASGAPSDAATRRLFRAMSRQKWPTRAPRIVVRCSGRGSGKTTDAAWLSAFHLLCVDHDAHAMPGSRVYNLVIGPRRQTAAESARIQRAVLDQLAPLGVAYEVLAERSDAIEILLTSPRTACDRVVRVVSFDAAAPRGYAIAFAHFPELGHAWTASTAVRQDATILQATLPRMAQFPRAQVVAESTPGPPRGVFFDWVQTPPRDGLLVRGSTFLFNPAIKESEARAWCPDARVYRQEIECSTFGHGGDTFLEPDAVVATLDQKDEWPSALAGEHSSVVSLDAGQLNDYFALCRASLVEDEIAFGKAIRHVVLGHVEHHRGNRENPIRVAAMAQRAVALAESKCPIVYDQHLAVEMRGQLAALGYREVKELRELHGRRMMQLSTSAAAQTGRFMLLREVVHGRRLHLPTTSAGRALCDELAALRATELAGGLLRVEGVGAPDDLADACAQAVEVCLQGSLAASDRSGARIEFRSGGHSFEYGYGLRARRPRWVKVSRDGREATAEMPPWAPGFERYAMECVHQGLYPPNVLAWWERQQVDSSDSEN